MHTLLTIEHSGDWAQLRHRDLMCVLDPMVLRTADLFFVGASGIVEDRRAEVWQAIDANLGALMTFVDTVLLWDELPVFSYWSTFAEHRLLERDPLTDVFWPVVVTGAEYQACKNSALTEADRLRDADPALIRSVLDELAAYDYEWQPELPIRPDEPEHVRRFFTFVLGGVLFDAYAQRLSVDGGTLRDQAQRILQPKRSRLLSQVATGASGSEEAVFAELAKQVNEQGPSMPRMTSFPKAPTFLPLLLKEDKVYSTSHLADRLMAWRRKGTVRDYRAWLSQLRKALALGHVPAQLNADLKAIAARCGSGDGPLDFELAVNVLTALPSVKLATTGPRLIGFVKQQLPGGRYQKLMYWALAAQNRYFDLAKHLRQLWYNS